MDHDRLLELLIKREEGIINMAEQSELIGLLKHCPDGEELTAMVRALFSSRAAFDNDITKKSVERSAVRLQNQLLRASGSVDKTRKIYWRKIAVVAAIVLLVVTLGLWLQAPSKTSLPQEVVTNKGSKSSLMLPDGTKVRLNANSKLSYNQTYGQKLREVMLEGEAYFEVIKDAKHPFIVHTHTVDIKVLGTVFNVRAYKNEVNTQTTLVKGSVEVLLKNKNDGTITLRPNEKIVVQNKNLTPDSISNTREITLQQAIPNHLDSGLLETLWTKKSIRFEQEQLNMIIPLLENWYHVKINVEDSSLLKRRFSGKIENEDLEEVLESFRLAVGMNYKIDKENVRLFK